MKDLVIQETREEKRDKGRINTFMKVNKVNLQLLLLLFFLYALFTRLVLSSRPMTSYLFGCRRAWSMAFP